MIVAVDPPEFVTCTDWVDVVDVVTEPKFTLVGEEANCPWATPVPLTAIAAEAKFLLPPLFELDDAVIETEPEIIPVADGAKITEKASDCPGASELDTAKPDTVKPGGTLTFVILTIELLRFVTLAACALVLPTTTLPKLMDVGATEICSADVGDWDLKDLVVAACKFRKLAAKIAARKTTEKQFPSRRGLRSFIGGTSTGQIRV